MQNKVFVLDFQNWNEEDRCLDFSDEKWPLAWTCKRACRILTSVNSTFLWLSYPHLHWFEHVWSINHINCHQLTLLICAVYIVFQLLLIHIVSLRISHTIKHIHRYRMFPLDPCLPCFPYTYIYIIWCSITVCLHLYTYIIFMCICSCIMYIYICIHAVRTYTCVIHIFM